MTEELGMYIYIYIYICMQIYIHISHEEMNVSSGTTIIARAFDLPYTIIPKTSIIFEYFYIFDLMLAKTLMY